jgi:uncharacterized protein YbjT (DUF2867 family)
MSNDAAVAEVRALVRHPLPPESSGARIREYRVDFDELHSHQDWFQVDWVFCALGTTMRAAGSQEAFRRVDYEYPLAIAKLALSGGASHFLLVSAIGANPRSHFFYNRVKGELEEAVRALRYRSLTIARPSLLLGKREEWRLGEEIAKRLGWVLPPRWRPVHASQVAAALLHAARAAIPGVQVLENAALQTFPYTPDTPT